MDKITRIHIAKVPYEIGISAEEMLNKYLAAIRRELDADLAEEIMADIEVRITELLNERNVKRDDVVSADDIKAVKEQLGSPEQFNDSESQTADGQNDGSGGKSRRLLRDPDDSILGGVAGGLGAYFNLDPVIFRIGFVLLTVIWGFGALIYLLLWLLVPEAISSSDKLQMKGEPVTAAALQRVRNSSERTISNLRIRLFLSIVFRLFRMLFTAGAVLFILFLLVVMGLGSAVLYSKPLHQFYVEYRLNYLLLGLLWLLIMTVIGLILVFLLRIWQKRAAPIKIAFISLIGILVLTVAGIAVVTPFVANYYKNQYGGNKLQEAFPVQVNGNTPPASFRVNGGRNLDVNYVSSSQPLHATLQSIPGMNAPTLSVTDTNGSITVNGSQLYKVVPSCLLNWCKNIYLPVKLTIYGPALKQYSANGGAELDLSNISQSALTLSSENFSTLYINSSYSNVMNLTAESNADISTTDTTALTANITVDQSSNISGPTSNVLNANLPGVCAQNILFLDQSPVSVSVNGQQTSVGNFSQNQCVNIGEITAPVPTPPQPVKVFNND